MDSRRYVRTTASMWPHASTINTITNSIADQIESNTCPICFELMKSPDFSPILLSPCGHTFCARCVTRHLSMHERKSRCVGGPHGAGPTPCPCCRQKISSQTLNISLQQMITNILSLQQTLEKADADASKFSNGFLQAQTRCHILQNELENSTRTKERMEKEIAETDGALVQLRAKGEALAENIRKVSLEHQKVQTDLMDTQNKCSSLKRCRDDVEAKVSLIQASLLALEQERDKYRLLSQDGHLLQAQVGGFGDDEVFEGFNT